MFKKEKIITIDNKIEENIKEENIDICNFIALSEMIAKERRNTKLSGPTNKDWNLFGVEIMRLNICVIKNSIIDSSK